MCKTEHSLTSSHESAIPRMCKKCGHGTFTDEKPDDVQTKEKQAAEAGAT